jgi:hypothetical protein
MHLGPFQKDKERYKKIKQKCYNGTEEKFIGIHPAFITDQVSRYLLAH